MAESGGGDESIVSVPELRVRYPDPTPQGAMRHGGTRSPATNGGQMRGTRNHLQPRRLPITPTPRPRVSVGRIFFYVIFPIASWSLIALTAIHFLRK